MAAHFRFPMQGEILTARPYFSAPNGYSLFKKEISPVSHRRKKQAHRIAVCLLLWDSVFLTGRGYFQIIVALFRVQRHLRDPRRQVKAEALSGDPDAVRAGE